MTNEELKKKIADIIYHTGCTGACCECEYSKVSEADTYCKALHKADALIAAGIGDVSELKKHRVVVEKSLIPEDDNAYVLPNIPPTVKQLYSGEEVEQIVKEREEYKHRAEVAERALFLSAKEIEYLNGDFDYSAEFFAKEKVIPYFMKKAEKELAEEGKDE